MPALFDVDTKRFLGRLPILAACEDCVQQLSFCAEARASQLEQCVTECRSACSINVWLRTQSATYSYSRVVCCLLHELYRTGPARVIRS